MKNKRYLVTLIAYTSAIVALMFLQIAVSLGCFNGLSEPALEVIGSVLPQVCIMFGIPFFILLAVQKINHETVSIKAINNQVSWQRIAPKHVALCFVLGICIFFLNLFVGSVFANLLNAFGWQSIYKGDEIVFHGYAGLLFALVLNAVLPALCEEFLHRGVLLNGLVKQFGVRRALLWSSLLFGLMHMNVGQFFYASILGWFMGTVALATGSLWGSIIIHFTNNALATYINYGDELYLPGIKFILTVARNPIVLILAVLVAFFVVGEVIRHIAREKFKRNLDSYTVRYLASQKQFGVEDFDRLKAALPTALQTLPTWKATAAYIETFDQPQPSKPVERALLTFVVLLGTVSTILSFVWGTW